VKNSTIAIHHTMMMLSNLLIVWSCLCAAALAFQSPLPHRQPTRLHDKASTVEEYRNAGTNILSNFMNNDSAMSKADALASIDFDAPKLPKMTIEKLAAKLDQELYEKEWFVTGNVNPSYFSSDFEFQDPDVKVSGIEDYARGVYKIFNQETSRAEIISTEVVSPNTMTVTWRLSGKVNIGPGLNIKPYLVYTDLTVDGNGLICFQEDRFDIPGWDILLSALFPFLIGKVTAEAAPPVEPRVFGAPADSSSSPFDQLVGPAKFLGWLLAAKLISSQIDL
jgi:hypothetical protein